MTEAGNHTDFPDSLYINAVISAAGIAETMSRFAPIYTGEYPMIKPARS